MKIRDCHTVLILVWVALGCVLGDDPQLNTNLGPIRGVWLKTSRDADIAGFLGIPYAKPPIQQLRFENPQQWTEKWTEVRNATSDGSKCMQLSETGVVGDEDCLYLNVFTPTISRDDGLESQKKNLSVIVFIHGGSYNTGSSNSSLYAPTYLLDHEIILVTLNYRLNILGFFSTGNLVAPGNYGLKDAAVALAWVHDNIEAFGGDPNSVTLMGHSSGAAMVHLLAASEATEGHFQKIITMSGSPMAKWAVHERNNMRNSSLHVAHLLGCADESDYEDSGSGDGENETVLAEAEDVEQLKIDRKIVECMKKVDPVDIIIRSYSYVWRRNPSCIYGPTLEPEAEGAILTVHPERSLGEGLFRDMPWINGLVDDEGLLKTTDLLLNSEIRDELLLDFDTLLPNVLEMQDSIDNVTAFSDAIKDFYFDGDILKKIEANITQMVGDALIAYPSYDFLQKRLSKMKSKIYFYVFAYEGTFSTTFRWDIPFRFGISHGDDLNYLFPFLNQRYADLQLFNTMGDTTMINIMSEMWINFAKTGVPSARLTSSWEPFQEHGRFMRFGDGRSTDRVMEQDFLTERMEFWRGLMENYSLPIEEHRAGEPVGDEHSPAAPTMRIDSTWILTCLAASMIWMYQGR